MRKRRKNCRKGKKRKAERKKRMLNPLALRRKANSQQASRLRRKLFPSPSLPLEIPFRAPFNFLRLLRSATHLAFRPARHPARPLQLLPLHLDRKRGSHPLHPLPRKTLLLLLLLWLSIWTACCIASRQPLFPPLKIASYAVGDARQLLSVWIQVPISNHRHP